MRFGAGGRTAELVVRPHRGAHGLRLSVDPARGRVLLTLPPQASKRVALAWAETRRAWVEGVLAAAPAPRPFAPGTALPWDDAELTIDWASERARTPRCDGDRLLCGGPLEHLSARVEAWARREAQRVLEAETRALAAQAGVSVERVRVGDPRTRWGSCGAQGTLSYSWRLLLAPAFVRRSVVAHEVAHRLHMHHGPTFHVEHRRLLGEDPGPADRWLRAGGRGLHLFGRG